MGMEEKGKKKKRFDRSVEGGCVEFWKWRNRKPKLQREKKRER